MGINIIKEEIKIIIETLGEQYAVINQQSGKIPQIELDIVMANIRKLYERLVDLNKLNSADPKSILEEIPEIIAETETKPDEIVETQPIAEPVIEPVMETVIEAVPETVPEPVAEPAVEVVEAVAEVVEPIIEVAEPLIEEKKIEIVFAEKEITPEIIEEVKETPVEIVAPKVDLEKTKEIIFDLQEVSTEEVKAPEATEEKKDPPPAEVKPAKSGKKESVDLFSLSEKETLADKFKETQKSMNDKIASEKPDKTLADKIGKTSIANLKTAIGINDKFLFINELFKGDIQEYNKTIDKLNSYTQLQECTGFLEEQKARYHWADKPDAYHKLEELLIRKFL